MNLYRKIYKYVEKKRAEYLLKHSKSQKHPIMKSEPESKLCIIPWMHLAFEPNGKVVPCCLTSHHNYFAGDLTTQPIEEIWNGENMKALRREFMQNKEPKICSTCFDRERATGESARIYHTRTFTGVANTIPLITTEDGTCTEMKLKYWDFSFSNLCNYKCRSCGPRFSSSWIPDAKKLGYISSQDKVYNIEQVDDSSNYDFLKTQIDYAEKIYFAGGEPLLMKEHWQILEMLVDRKKFNVRVSYNTNASTLVYNGKNVLDYWKLWDSRKLEVWPSIDEIGERAELIRSGTVWSKVEENLKAITKLNNIWIRPGITVGAWNVRRLPVIINHLIDIGVIKEQYYFENFFMNMLMQPEHYHVSILPESYRKETIQELKDFIETHNKKYSCNIDGHFTHLLFELEKSHNPRALNKFFKITSDVDKVRNENLFEVIPELKFLKDI